DLCIDGLRVFGSRDWRLHDRLLPQPRCETKPMNPTHAKPNTRSSLLRVAGNAASLLTTDLLNKATTFVLYALIGRYLGAEAFGRFSLGLLLVYVFQVFASVG